MRVAATRNWFESAVVAAFESLSIDIEPKEGERFQFRFTSLLLFLLLECINAVPTFSVSAIALIAHLCVSWRVCRQLCFAFTNRSHLYHCLCGILMDEQTHF